MILPGKFVYEKELDVDALGHRQRVFADRFRKEGDTRGESGMCRDRLVGNEMFEGLLMLLLLLLNRGELFFNARKNLDKFVRIPTKNDLLLFLEKVDQLGQAFVLSQEDSREVVERVSG